MKSLEERHAERERHRKEGPGPVVIEKDPEQEAASTVDEEEREPMRNKRPGSSKEQPGAEARVEGDDSIDSGFTFGLAGDETQAVVRSTSTESDSGSRTAAKAASKKTEGAGNGGGSTWNPKP